MHHPNRHPNRPMQEEGIVVKSLDSKYLLNDRSGAWLKVKPDYAIKVCWVSGHAHGGGGGGLLGPRVYMVEVQWS